MKPTLPFCRPAIRRVLTPPGGRGGRWVSRIKSGPGIRNLLLLIFTLGLLGCSSDERHPALAYSIRGIDVSRYQAEVDWPLVKAVGVDFVFVKASEGGDHRDERFVFNWSGLAEAGLHRGAYHYFRPEVSARRQVNNFVNAVGDLRNGDLPPVLDVEERGSDNHADFLRNVSGWLGQVEERYGVKPILYTGQKFYNRYLAGHFPDYPVWIARYKNEVPVLADGRDFTFWQYTDSGIVPGIEGPVDINVFFGDHLALGLLTVDSVRSDDGPVTFRGE